MMIRRLLLSIGAAFLALTSLSQAAAPTTVYTFSTVDPQQQTNADGRGPSQPLPVANGSLYGITTNGGAHTYGTFYHLVGSTLTPLYSFDADALQNGGLAGPPEVAGTIALGTDGNFYGASAFGGDNGSGAIFKLTTNNSAAGTSFTLVHSFGPSFSFPQVNGDGYSPQRGVSLGSDGIYGVTRTGGASGWGTIFKLAYDGTFTSLHQFTTFGSNDVNDDGWDPLYPPIKGQTDDFMYGVTRQGGTNGKGVLYRIDSAGSFTRLYSFNGPGLPAGGVVQGPDANGKLVFYGSHDVDNTLHTNGRVYKIVTDGTEAGTTYSVVHDFSATNTQTGTNSDGIQPYGSLAVTADGTLYGAAREGGANSNGTLFSVSTAGAFSVLSAFPATSGLPTLADGLTVGADGAVYGVMVNSIFKYDPADNSTALPAISSFSINPGATPGEFVFSASTRAGVTLSLEYTTTPADEASWNAFSAHLVETTPGQYTLATTAYPTVSGLYFRVVSTKTGLTPGKSSPLGPFDLSATVTLTANGPASDGAIIYFTAVPKVTVNGQETPLSGQTLLMQYSTTPDVPSSWQYLTFPNNGNMTEEVQNKGFYAFDTSAYPGAENVHFRAVFRTPFSGNVYSNVLGPYSLHQAFLVIETEQKVRTDATSQPFVSPTVRNGQDLVYQINFRNDGNVLAQHLHIEFTVPTYVEAVTHDTKNFSASDFVDISPGGVYVPETSAGAHNAKVVWDDVGNLNGGGVGNFVRCIVHIPATAQASQYIQINNSSDRFATLSSKSGNPGQVAKDAHAQSEQVQGPILFTLVPKSTTVAPGGLITFTGTVTNLSTVAVANVAAVVETPNNARFAQVYRPATGAAVAGVTWATKRGAPNYIANYLTALPQVVINVGALFPAGDRLHRDSASFNVTFQVQWIDATTPATLTIPSYVAGFFDPKLFTDPNPPVPPRPNRPAPQTNFYTLFARLFATASDSTSQDLSATDFAAYITSADHVTASAAQNSGTVSFQVSGSNADRPRLFLTKKLDTVTAARYYNGSETVQLVGPGDKVSFTLTVRNFGKTVASDVYLRDRMPDHTTFVSTAIVDRTTASAKLSQPTFTGFYEDTQDGVHYKYLVITGLQLLPGEQLSVQYSVEVDGAPGSGTTAPPNNTELNPTQDEATDAFGFPIPATVGSSSIEETPTASYVDAPLIFGQVQFAEPISLALVQRLTVTNDVAATGTRLGTFYARRKTAALPNPSFSIPWDTPNDLNTLIPGAQRYYLHVENPTTLNQPNVSVEFTLPANTFFHRAGYADLQDSQVTGAIGNFPGLLRPATAAGLTANQGSVDTPLANQGGKVVFHLKGPLTVGRRVVANSDIFPAKSYRDMFVDVIVGSGAVQPSSVLVGGPDASPVVIKDTAGHSASAPLMAFKVTGPKAITAVRAARSVVPKDFSTPPETPKMGFFALAPQSVPQGATEVQVQYVVFNAGNVPCTSARLTVPPLLNAQIAAYGTSSQYPHQFPDTTNGDAVVTWDTIPAHAAVSIVLTLDVTGAVGSEIADDHSSTATRVRFQAPYVGTIFPAPLSVLVSAANSPASATYQTSISGAALHSYTVDGYQVFVVDLEGGQTFACANPQEITSADSGQLGSAFGFLAYANAPAQIHLGGTTVDYLLANLANFGALQTVHSQPPTVVVPAGVTLKAPPGAVLIGAGGGAYVPPAALLTRAGYRGADAGIVAQGGGNFVGHNGSAIVAQGGGNATVREGAPIVAQGGGNAVPQPPAIVAQGGGNLIGQDGNGVVPSTADGTALVNTNGSNIVAQGGGNAVAQGGGNIVAQGGGN